MNKEMKDRIIKIANNLDILGYYDSADKIMKIADISRPERETLNVEISNLTQKQADQMKEFLEMIHWCAMAGGSRTFSVFFDGDGAFNCKIKINGEDADYIEVPSKYNQPDVQIGFE